MLSISILRSMRIFMVLFSFVLVSNVQAKPEQGKKIKDWTVVCEKLPKTQKEACYVFQNVTNDKGTVVMRIAIAYLPEKTKSQALITLPLGVLLQPGIEFKGGAAEAFRVPFGVCVKNGCVAITELDDTIIKSMKSGTKGSVKFFVSQKKTIEISISLSGFTAAWDSIEKLQME